MLKRLKGVFLGKALKTSEERHERLSNTTGLAVFASDALSSTAYATEEILKVLVIAGTAVLWLSLPMSIAITAVIAIVILSYRQTIKAYPKGSGAYLVTKDNLGIGPAQGAAAMLLIDYILTVAVSINAGVAALTSAFPGLKPHTIQIAIGFIIIIAWGNLRGVKEAGKIFAAPTYIFIGLMFALIAVGLIKWMVFGLEPIVAPHETAAITRDLGIFFLLRAFAAGCTALTGIEAVSDGVGAFREPEAKNAVKTLTVMGAILGTIFLGITVLARHLHVIPSEHETVVSIVARAVFGNGILYFAIQGSTMLILVLAANTAYADFPRLASFLAKDKLLPHSLLHRGYRLVYSFGIIVLSVAAIGFVLFSKGDLHHLIPLYAVGVFSAFTLSQTSMIKRSLTRREAGWKKALTVNALGGITTFVVLIIIVVTKISHGAWIVLVLAGALIALFRVFKGYYKWVADELTPRRRPLKLEPRSQTYIILVSEVTRATLEAVQNTVAKKPDHIRAVHVALNDERVPWIKKDWTELAPKYKKSAIPLDIIDCEYRDLVEVIVEYLNRIDKEWDDDIINAVIPVFSVSNKDLWKKFLHHICHEGAAKRIANELDRHDNIEVIKHSYVLDD